MMGEEGGGGRGSYFIPYKNPNFRFFLPKKIPQILTTQPRGYSHIVWVGVCHWEGDIGVCGFAVLALFCLGFSEFEILKLGFAVFYSTAICGC